ncbi:uncharacterized protein G2W53_034901 [Senna tora]|uniref:Uncharacterized protein n=1 Tax=Senna tora TaxID=362788 RepID=A0A834T1L1_9FABA|nr:uncharacterized protein G2W53_034901 [Senna tora]
MRIELRSKATQKRTEELLENCKFGIWGRTNQPITVISRFVVHVAEWDITINSNLNNQILVQEFDTFDNLSLNTIGLCLKVYMKYSPISTPNVFVGT